MGHSRTTRRVLLKTGLGAVAGNTLLAGCSTLEGATGSGEGTTDSGSGDNALRIATDSDPGSPLNIYASSGSTFDWMTNLVYDRLIQPSPYVKPQNQISGLATKTNKINDTTWTATVRSDTEWQDGKSFTADDVAFTYRYYRDGSPNRYTHHVSQVPHIKHIKAVDDQTVRFECAYPSPQLAHITFADLPILPKHVWKDIDDPSKYPELPVGTGPYKLVDYKPGKRLRFKSNKNYFRSKPLVDEVIIPFIQDHSAIFAALKSGNIDTTSVPLSPSTVNQFKQNNRLNVVHATTLTLIEMRINFERSPFDQPDFRWAVSRAIDKQSLVDVVMLGKAIPGTKGYPHPKSPWTAPDIKQPYKPKEVRSKLADIGFRDRDGDGVRETPDGKKVSFTLKVPSNEPSYIRAAELVAENLTDVGLKTKAKSLDPGTIGSLFDSRNFDMYISSITPHGVANPDQFVMSHRSGYLWDKDIPYPAWDKLFKKYKQSKTVKARKKVGFEMQRLFNSQPTSVPLWYPEPRFAFRPKVYDKWAESPGYGIHNKWSLLPKNERKTAVTQSFD